MTIVIWGAHTKSSYVYIDRSAFPRSDLLDAVSVLLSTTATVLAAPSDVRVLECSLEALPRAPYAGASLTYAPLRPYGRCTVCHLLTQWLYVCTSLSRPCPAQLCLHCVSLGYSRGVPELLVSSPSAVSASSWAEVRASKVLM